MYYLFVSGAGGAEGGSWGSRGGASSVLCLLIVVLSVIELIFLLTCIFPRCVLDSIFTFNFTVITSLPCKYY